jgi:hypothetical protein
MLLDRKPFMIRGIAAALYRGWKSWGDTNKELQNKVAHHHQREEKRF